MNIPTIDMQVYEQEGFQRLTILCCPETQQPVMLIEEGIPLEQIF